MDTLVLETIEPAFSRGIIPTIPLAAHRADHAVLFQPVLEVKTGILTAPIRVMDQPCRRFPAEPRHGQRIEPPRISWRLVGLS